MPFLGNTPANTFVSIAKQTITGNGGTSYSLSYAVTSANDIDVFYNNVRQEPGVAYTANGTTITFTEAIQSTDSVYILFNGQAVGTIDAPAGAYLPTTGGTVNGQVIVNNKIQIQQDAGSNNRLILRGTSGSSYRWNVDNFGSSNQFRIFRENDSDATLGMVAAQFDSGGRLRLPQQPFFHVTRGAGDVASGNVINWNVVFENNGSYYNTSNGRFTAPVDGAYYFAVSVMSAGVDVTMDIAIRKNGSIDHRCVPYQAATGGAYNQVTGVAIFNLVVNDYIDVYVNQGPVYANNSGSNGRHSMFCGHLIG